MPELREDDLFKESTMTFGEHLEELRTCLFKSLMGLMIGFVIGLLVGQNVVDFIQMPLSNALDRYVRKESKQQVKGELQRVAESGHPLPLTPDEVDRRVDSERLLADERYLDLGQVLQVLQELKSAYPDQFKSVQLPPPSEIAEAGQGERLIPLFLWHRSSDDPRLRTKGMAVSEPFSIYIKASLLVGVLLASPWIFYQIWHFVAAGLYPHERRYVHTYLPFSLGLFLLGAAMAFFVVFQPVLDFLLSFNRSQGIDPELRIKEWLGFVLVLPLGFGISFQLPLVMLFLERIGVFTVRSYLKQWRVAVLVIFVLAALLTPPDIYSPIFMGLSMTFLYFGGVLLCKWMPRKPNPFGQTGRR